jgi:rfaE bifunctional protein kinase chain/domain
MNLSRVDELLDNFPTRRILVVGDFFLDEYRIIDRRLSETSLETGLEAYQVVAQRSSPGAAGNVSANLAALGCQVTVLGVIGQDGRGFELKRALAKSGVDPQGLIESGKVETPTYTKPLVVETDGRQHELERQDVKNRSPLPASLEDKIIRRLREWLPAMDAVVIVDQVIESDCGVITTRVRDEIVGLATLYPNVVVAADSRARIGLFRQVIFKPNTQEALSAIEPAAIAGSTLERLQACALQLYQRAARPVFLTLGEQGILVASGTGCQRVPAVPVSGEIDIVGAGDSCMAGLVAALACGAQPAEAAFLGNLVASVTIQQIGVTGTASPAQLRAQYLQHYHSP